MKLDEKLLPFAIEEFADQCCVYGSDIPHIDRPYGAVDVVLKRNDISEESKRKLLVDNTARSYGLENLAKRARTRSCLKDGKIEVHGLRSHCGLL